MAPELTTPLAIAVIVYVVALFALSLVASRRVESEEDFLVAGRRLPLSLAWATLFATWFGAGTLLTATDEVRAHGLRRIALDPLGAGLCLLLAALLLARPLWRMKLLTLADFYRDRFGPRAETFASIAMIPGYTGWIAAQLVAMSQLLHLFFGLPVWLGVALVCLVGTGYALVGGMWSVTLTDAAQMVLLIFGVVALFYEAFVLLGEGSLVDGLAALHARLPAAQRVVVPTESARETVVWIGVLCAGALGNLPGQDLMQRVFASKSERVAVSACLIAGLAYLSIGALPVLTGAAGGLLFPESSTSVLAYMAQRLLHGPLAVVFLLAVMSAVLSTIDSAILSPASLLSENLLVKTRLAALPPLRRSHLAVVVIGGVSLVVAYLGESAYSLLETAYEIGVVSLLVPLLAGLYWRRGGERAALASMGVGTALWLLHLALGWELFLHPLLHDVVPLPLGLSCAACGLVGYLALSLQEGSAA